MKTFDFTSNRVLNVTEVARLERIGCELIGQYNEVIDSISQQYAKSLSWWSSSIASRYTYENSVFDDLALFFLFEKYAAEYDVVIVSCQHMYRLLKAVKNRKQLNYKIIYKRQWDFKGFVYSKELARLSYRIFTSLIWRILMLSTPKKKLGFKKISLIRNFILPSTEFGLNKDACFPGLYEFLTENEELDVFNLPLLCVKIREIRKILKKIKADAHHQTILIDQYLKPLDYCRMAVSSVKSLFISFQRATINEYNVGGLLKKDHLSSVGSHMIAALSFYFAIKNLSKSGVEIQKLYSWYEGQAIDKMTMLSFSRFSPTTLTIGYQGFLESKYLLSVMPSPCEIASNVLPNYLTTCFMDVYYHFKSCFCNLRVEMAPGFRFNAVSEKRLSKVKKKSTRMLILLSLNKQDTASILQMLPCVLEALQENAYEFCIRPHPADMLAVDQVNALCSQYDNITRSTSSMQEELNQSDVAFGACTSVMLEAVMKGLTVLLYGSRQRLTRNLFERISSLDDRYELVYTVEQIIQALNKRSRDSVKHFDVSKLLVSTNHETMTSFMKVGCKQQVGMPNTCDVETT
jgi:hypothetical protein